MSGWIFPFLLLGSGQHADVTRGHREGCQLKDAQFLCGIDPHLKLSPPESLLSWFYFLKPVLADQQGLIHLCNMQRGHASVTGPPFENACYFLRWAFLCNLTVWPQDLLLLFHALPEEICFRGLNPEHTSGLFGERGEGGRDFVTWPVFSVHGWVSGDQFSCIVGGGPQWEEGQLQGRGWAEQGRLPWEGEAQETPWAVLLCSLCSFAGAAITKFHTLGGFKSRDCFTVLEN